MPRIKKVRTLETNICPYCGQPTLKAFMRRSVLWTACPNCGMWRLFEWDAPVKADNELVTAEASQDEGTDKSSDSEEVIKTWIDSEGVKRTWTKEDDRKLGKLLRRLGIKPENVQADK